MKKKVKALVLLSGGLDSILAVKLLSEQGIEVEAINFRTNFCGPSKARPAAKMLGVPMREVNIREDFLAVLKKPKYGYGAGLNPCIDCHALMLKKAGEIMWEEGYSFVATGEVLGERPMSQHKKALKIVEKEAGLEGYLLRPLSAKLLESTVPEKEGLVDREKLLAISGRNRQPQMELAARYGIKNYPTPAGGCALTQAGFTKRLKELAKHKPDFDVDDVDLVGLGRHFWLASPNPPAGGEGGVNGVQIILGRNKEENEILKSARKSQDVFIIPLNFLGPEALIKSAKISNNSIAKAKELIVRFSPKAKGRKTEELNFEVFD
ncbi:tRNA 4-thiouridine(8) synthase ThiI [Patescibacteria group bacterium]|nr:tRNA 4-thiouridine(8) synthase ThiI [Patescibacteria group bacterium]